MITPLLDTDSLFLAPLDTGYAEDVLTDDLYIQNQHDTPRQASLADVKPKKKLTKSKTIRHIDSINYIADYTKGGNVTGAYCGASVIAMLAGISLDEAVKLMEGIPASKAGLKQVLDYYGIQYAPKSAHFDPNVPLPEICILRFYILDENGKAHTGFGHWGLYYMGKFYDPDWGISDECPKRLRLFQIWEIYK
jgi:hypothetical protein